jgi:hypothetical protein
VLVLDLTADIGVASASLSNLARKHVPFAAARALTSVAYDARDEVRAQLPKRFIIRRPWVAKGIGVERATKADLEATVFSRDKFMDLQEEGGTKTGKQVVPVGRLAQTAKSAVIPRSQWPGRLMARKSVFYRAGTLFERRGKEIHALYLLGRQVRVRPRFGMEQAVHMVTLRNFRRRFEEALLKAMAR